MSVTPPPWPPPGFTRSTAPITYGDRVFLPSWSRWSRSTPAPQFEADRRGLSVKLNEFPAPDPVLLDAVTCADMTTSPAGVPITAEARLADIFDRYSLGTPVSDAVHTSAPDLLAAVSRCERRVQVKSQRRILRN